MTSLKAIRSLIVPFALVVGVITASARENAALTKVPLPVIPKNKVKLTDFGAKGDGITLNTHAFARAIAALSAKGGGELVVPPGFWLTGPIRLRSNINLHLQRGALIQFSRDYHLYPLMVVDMKGEKEVVSTSPIFGDNLENVAITGAGVLDGGGSAWRPLKQGKVTARAWKARVKSGGVVNPRSDTWWPSRAAMTGAELVAQLQKEGSLDPKAYEPAHQFLRPKMLCLINCRKVLLEGVTFQNPPMWTLNPLFCQDISILHVKIHNSFAAQNSDALDLESCQHAVVLDCTFNAGDDGICLKSGKGAYARHHWPPTEDVLIEGCTVYHAHGGFVIGSEMSGCVRDVWVNNCTFMGTDVGLRFKSTRGRGGEVENIHISNVRMKDIEGNAINFNMYYGHKTPLKVNPKTHKLELPPVTAGTPRFRNIYIKNVICRGADDAIFLQGLPEMPIRNIDFKNVSITSKQGVFVTDAEGIHFDQVQVDRSAGPALTETRVKNSSLKLLK